MKLFRTLCVVAIALCFVASAYAETQSVKISGDITIRSLMRADYDMDHDHDESLFGGAAIIYPVAQNMRKGIVYLPGSSDWDTYFMTTTEVQIDADLTDNVSAVIRLFNQRDWNRSVRYFDEDLGLFGVPILPAAYALGEDLGIVNADEFSVGIDLAYIELKEFLYSPLTLRIGRQDIWFGKGFIVGRNQRNPFNSISAPEYTCMESFDAIRATLDYDPWTIDGIAAKIWENDIGSNDDINLYGINVGYIFDDYNAEAEAYWFWKQDAGSVPSQRIDERNDVHTIGLRGSADPIENWTVAAEGAYQFGDYVGYFNQMNSRERSAWAFDISAECRHFKEMFEWKPVVGLEYIVYSGDGEENPNRLTSGTYNGWDPMFRGKFDSAIREFYGTYYLSAQGLAAMGISGNNPEASFTNQHQAIVMASMQPTDSLTVDARYAAFWQYNNRDYFNPVSARFETRDEFIGQEIDLQLTWDYTEDVTFSLLTAWYFPGKTYFGGQDDTVTDIVGTVKLSF